MVHVIHHAIMVMATRRQEVLVERCDLLLATGTRGLSHSLREQKHAIRIMANVASTRRLLLLCSGVLLDDAVVVNFIIILVRKYQSAYTLVIIKSMLPHGKHGDAPRCASLGGRLGGGPPLARRGPGTPAVLSPCAREPLASPLPPSSPRRRAPRSVPHAHETDDLLTRYTLSCHCNILQQIGCTRRRTRVCCHAKNNKTAGRIIPLLVLRF